MLDTRLLHRTPSTEKKNTRDFQEQNRDYSIGHRWNTDSACAKNFFSPLRLTYNRLSRKNRDYCIGNRLHTNSACAKHFFSRILTLSWPRTRPLGPRPRPADFEVKKKKNWHAAPDTTSTLGKIPRPHTHTSYRVFPVWLTHQTPICSKQLFQLLSVNVEILSRKSIEKDNVSRRQKQK